MNCNNCGKPKEDHAALSLRCPIGRKSRVLGYTQYGETVYAEPSPADEILGYRGKCLGSKSGYRDANPDNLVVFNANICTATAKIWHGDIDITLDEPKLLALHRKLGETIYVLYEMDGRFDNEKKPLIDKAILVVDCDMPKCSLDSYGRIKGKLVHVPNLEGHGIEQMLTFDDIDQFKSGRGGDPLLKFYNFIREKTKYMDNIDVSKVKVSPTILYQLTYLMSRHLMKTCGYNAKRAERITAMEMFNVGPSVWRETKDDHEPYFVDNFTICLMKGWKKEGEDEGS